MDEVCSDELSLNDLDEVNGGLLPLLAAAAAEVGMGMLEGAVAAAVVVGGIKIYEAVTGNTVKLPV